MVIEDNLKLVKDGVLLKIRIVPNSSKNQFIISDEIIKLKITAQPIENKANKAVVEYLSKLFKMPKTSIEIVKGDTSKDKTLLLKTTDSQKIENVKSVISSIEK
jgi:uncharacterized protein (TIGR00251 family)